MLGERPVANITHSTSSVAAVLQRHGVVRPVLLDGGDVGVDAHVDLALEHLGHQAVAHVLVEAAQDLLAAVDQRRLDAEAVEDAGELDGDVAAADDQDRGRQLLQMERLVGGDGVLGAGQVRLHRMAAGGDQDGLGRDLAAVRGAGRRCWHRPASRACRTPWRRRSRRCGGRCPRGARSPCPCWRSGSASRSGCPEWSSRSPPHPRTRRGSGWRRRTASWGCSRGSRRCRRSGIPRRCHLGAVAGCDAPSPHAARAAADDEQVEVVVAHGEVPCTLVLHGFVTPGSFRRP